MLQSLLAPCGVVFRFCLIANAVKVGIDADEALLDRRPASFAEAGGRDTVRGNFPAGSFPEDPESFDRQSSAGIGRWRSGMDRKTTTGLLRVFPSRRKEILRSRIQRLETLEETSGRSEKRNPLPMF